MLDITLGRPRQYQALTVFPLFGGDGASLPLVLLPDVLEAGTLHVTEVGEGTVPTLLARNEGPDDLLVLDGEQLIGARQNRTTSRSMVIPSRSQVHIPVSCMEQGRWHSVSAEFKHSPYNSPATVRRHARRTEADAAAVGVRPPVQILGQAQSLVWSEIARKSAELDARSETGALDAVYEQSLPSLHSFLAAFPWEERQVGMLALLGDRPLGMDVLGDAELYGRVHPRLIMGYALDALSHRRRPASDGGAAALAYFQSVRTAGRTEAPTVGRGRYQVLSGDGVVGAELEDGGRMVHLSAFPAPESRREDVVAY